jgi:DNA polymerase III epsilon subunit-like protein
MRRKLVAWDLETGGLEMHHPITQLAAVAVYIDTFEEVATYEAKIQFREEDCEPVALQVNHYSRERWANAKPEAQVMREFARFLKDHATVEQMSKRTGKPFFVARLAGHNVVNFDQPRTAAMWERAGGGFFPAHYQCLDTLQRAMWWAQEADLTPESFRLENCLKMMGLDPPAGPLHDALNDCRASIAIAKFCAGLSR